MRDLAEVFDQSEPDDNHSNIDDQEELGMEQHGDLTADMEHNRVEPTEPQTPQQPHRPQASSHLVICAQRQNYWQCPPNAGELVYRP